jgi:zinc protease
MVFYRRYYQPANTFLVVSGDITLEELKPLVQTHYGNVKTAFKPERRWVKEPPQQTYRKVVFTHKAVEQPGFRRTYQAPSLNDGNKELAIPSMLLAQLVGNGLTSYLYQTLVEEQAIATSAEAYYSGFSLGPGSFTIHVIPSRETSLSTIENAVEDALETFKATLIDDEDLVRAQTILKAESVYTRDGLEQLARILGTLHAIGLDQLFFHNWNDTIEAVTAEHIQAAAKHIFKRNHSVTGFLLPEDTQ